MTEVTSNVRKEGAAIDGNKVGCAGGGTRF